MSLGTNQTPEQGGPLTHDDWLQEIRAATHAEPVDATGPAPRLRALLERIDQARKIFVSSWHSRQCAGLLAQSLADQGSLAAAAEVDERAAGEAEEEMRELRQAAGFRYLTAALYRFRLGQDEQAMSLAEKAFSLADPYVDPSATCEEVLREVRRVRAERSGGGGLAGEPVAGV